MTRRRRPSRREVLVVAALAATPAAARSGPTEGGAMQVSIRAATVADIPEMTRLLLADARAREIADPRLWPVDAGSADRVAAALGASLSGPGAGPPQPWLLAEAGGRIVGVAHALLVGVPPIYDVGATPGLFLDDCCLAPDAPDGAAERLLLAMEETLRDVGATSMIASCPAAGPWRRVYEAQGYEPVTLYLSKSDFDETPAAATIRPATVDDIPAIVRLSADHRRVLAALNSRFWRVHPEADARFGQWMRYSLNLRDRDMLVAGPPGEIKGYAIAQPVSPLLVPSAHDIAHTGVVDDFHAEDFADPARLVDGGEAGALLAAAESAFARRGVTAALVVCPAAWTSKVALLERQGYRTAKIWMLKRQP